MAKQDSEPELNPNHIRALSAALIGLEEMCSEAARLAHRKSGELVHIEDELTPAQEEELRQLTARLRAEIRRLAKELRLSAVRRSRRGSIVALLMTNIAQLEDIDSARLRGYGPLSEVTKHTVDVEIARLVGLLEQMVKVLKPA